MATQTVVAGSHRSTARHRRPVERRVGPPAQESARRRRSLPRHLLAVRRHLRAAPRAVPVLAAGPESRLRGGWRPVAAAESRARPRDGSAGSRSAQPPTRRRADQRHRGPRRAGRHPRDRCSDRCPRWLVRRPPRQRPDAVHGHHLRLPRPAVHHPAVGRLPGDGLRAGARRPVAGVRRHRPDIVGHGGPARPWTVARRSRKRSSSRRRERSACRIAGSSPSTCCRTAWARSSWP